MTNQEKQELMEYFDKCCRTRIFREGGVHVAFYKVSDVYDTIRKFEAEPTEGETTDCDCKNCGSSPDYEKLNAELKKELEYWKNQYRNLRNENVRMEAIIRTIEALTDKCLLD